MNNDQGSEWVEYVFAKLERENDIERIILPLKSQNINDLMIFISDLIIPEFLSNDFLIHS